MSLKLPKIVDGVTTDAVMRIESLDAETTTTSKRTPIGADEVSRVLRGGRDGRVLRKQTVLKADHYPSCHNPQLQEQVEGAPNFRQPMEQQGLPVFGTAAPTHDGLVAVCERISPRKEPILWINLRQEPMLYIHGRPFSVKERDEPFKAMENRGIQLADVEQAEVLLKLEVIAEARRSGGRLLVLDESPPATNSGLCAKGELLHYYEANVSGATVWTPREMFELARLELGVELSFHRVPITDEQAPHEEDFDAIVRHMQAAHAANPATRYVFNCALGRGRTTSGLSIACLTWRAIANDSQRAAWDTSSIKMLPPPPVATPDFAWGEYAAVVALTQLLPSGAERKAFVDCVIDANAHMQNLRADILPKKRAAENTDLAAKKREVALVTGRKYLERYMYLLLFNAYVCRKVDRKSSQYRPPLDSQRLPSFKEWLDEQGDESIGRSLYPMLDGLTLE